MHHSWGAGAGLDQYTWTILSSYVLVDTTILFLAFFSLDINDFFNRINFGYIILEKCQTYFTALLFSCSAMTILKMLGLCIFHSRIPVSEVGQPFFLSTSRTFILNVVLIIMEPPFIINTNVMLHIVFKNSRLSQIDVNKEKF